MRALRFRGGSLGALRRSAHVLSDGFIAPFGRVDEAENDGWTRGCGRALRFRGGSLGALRRPARVDIVAENDTIGAVADSQLLHTTSKTARRNLAGRAGQSLAGGAGRDLAEAGTGGGLANGVEQRRALLRRTAAGAEYLKKYVRRLIAFVCIDERQEPIHHILVTD